MRARWKSRLSDSFVQLAVILSLLRTDLRVYLRQYSTYPEVQQALLGQSVGLHLVDNYHNNDLLPHPSSKYIIDDNEHIFNELHRLVGSTRLFQHNVESSVSTWLVTNNTSVLPLTSTTLSATAGPTQVELSEQDVQLIEDLWKQDVESLFDRTQFSVNPKEQDNCTTDDYTDEGIAEGFDFQSPEELSDSANNEDLLWTRVDSNGTEATARPPYNTQSSLERALQDLVSYNNQSDMLDVDEERATNSSLLYPDGYSSQYPSFQNRMDDANSTGVLWASQESQQLSRQISNMEFEGLTPEEADFVLPLLDDLPAYMDFELDPANILAFFEEEEDHDRVSVDSAVGSSPPHSWNDGSSTTGSERHSISSTDQLDLEDGAVGYTKTEPYERKYFEPFRNKSAVSHNHTYGAPPGGVPHVRKMDIKTTKEPSRGHAHDEKLCKKFNIPFTVDIIINSPVDAFNSLLQSHKLSPKQVTLVKDIRRRGKNKVAAQNCRQKRVGEYSGLEEEVDKLRAKRDSLYNKHAVLLNKTTQSRKEIDIMSTEIFRTLRDENGMPYNASQVSLEVGRDGEIHVTSTQQARGTRGTKKRDSRKRRS